MDEFNDSMWGDTEKDQAYREENFNFLQEREKTLEIMGSFFKFFIQNKEKVRVLDIGCGDGILSKTIYNRSHDIELVVQDGSGEMIKAAKKNLAGLPVHGFYQLTFEEVINGGIKEEPFDLIVSSMAVHHLYMENKRRLFEKIPGLLKNGGYFMNIDVVLPDNDYYGKWYYKLWQEWIIRRRETSGSDKNYDDLPDRARDNPENHYDKLEAQLLALKAAGLSEVECHYKYGLFAVYGGKK